LMTFKALKYGEPSHLTGLLSYLDPDTNISLRSADDPYRLLEPRAVCVNVLLLGDLFLVQHLEALTV